MELFLGIARLQGLGSDWRKRKLRDWKKRLKRLRDWKKRLKRLNEEEEEKKKGLKKTEKKMCRTGQSDRLLFLIFDHWLLFSNHFYDCELNHFINI